MVWSGSLLPQNRRFAGQYELWLLDLPRRVQGVGDTHSDVFVLIVRESRFSVELLAG